MNAYLINTFIKYIGINFCAIFSFYKIANLDIKSNTIRKISILPLSILLTIIHCFLQYTTSSILIFSITLIIYNIVLSKLSHFQFSYSLLIALLSFSLSYIFCGISTLLILVFYTFIDDMHDTKFYIAISILNLLLTYYFFKIRRFKNGFPFLNKYKNNDYFNIIILVISIIILFTYFLIGEITLIPTYVLVTGFIFFITIMILVFQKFFILYQTQKLQLKTLKDYEQELAETKQKLAVAIEEKQKLVQSNHEFYHRQEALNKKLDDLLILQSHSTNTEFGEEYGEIINRINQMSDEYKSKTETLPHLVKCGITEIDDMLTYMQSECYKNNIELIVKSIVI